MNNEEKKYVAFCCDNNYAKYLMTTINSICITNINQKIVFCIFSSDLDNQSKEAIKSLILNVPPYNKEYLFFDIDDNKLEGVLLDNLDNRITIATCYRFFVPYYLNNICDKVLYLDVDLCVTNELDELFSVSLNDNIIGAVNEVVPYHRELKIENYFNAGVLLIDVKKWNQNDFTKKCINELKRIAYKLADQDVLNILLKDNRYILPEKFNYKYNLDSLKKSNHMPPDDVCIIHFLAESKPWCLWTQDFNVVKNIYNKFLLSKENANLTLPKTSTQIRKMIKNSYTAGKYSVCKYWILKYLKLKLFGEI